MTLIALLPITAFLAARPPRRDAHIVVMRADAKFESWMSEHLLSLESISRGVGLLLTTFNEFAAEK